jgi:NADPH:quinone reductase-like Zn-dependent oxidoreductase
MPANTAVWLRKKNGGRIAVAPAPYPNPRAHEIVVRNYAVAVNPADWIIAIMVCRRRWQTAATSRHRTR